MTALTTREVHSEAPARAPLDGIRVLDWTIWQQGPVASTMLGDLGAEVIKIESRDGGDPGRGILSMSGVRLDERPNFYFECCNRNKKSITLDLSKPEGLEVARALAEKSDVFVQNFRKGVAQRLGLGYEDLRLRNPRLIYANATGYGPEGPESGEPSFDYLGLARSGIMQATGEPDMPPLAVAGAIADQMGAIMLAHGVITALLARERFGIGQQVHASHLGSMAMLQGLSLSMRLMMGAAMPRSFRAKASNALWNHYRCADGQWLALSMLQSDRYWADFCRAIGREALILDERFRSLLARARNAAACVAELDAVFATKPRAAWLQILRDSPGDFIFTVVNSVDDLPDDPQMRANDYVVDFEHPHYGTIQMLGHPVGFSETPARVRSGAPELGQHTEEVLLDVLGYDWEQITALRKAEAI